MATVAEVTSAAVPGTRVRARPLDDRVDAFRHHDHQLRGPRQHVGRKARNVEGVRHRRGADGMDPVRFRLVLRRLPNPGRLAARPLRLQAGLLRQHLHLVLVHPAPGRPRAVRHGGGRLHPVHPSSSRRGGRVAVVSRQRTAGSGLVSRQRAWDGFGDLQFRAIFRDRSVRPGHGRDRISLRLALRLLFHGRTWNPVQPGVAENDLQPEGASAPDAARARLHRARRGAGEHGSAEGRQEDHARRAGARTRSSAAASGR